MKIKNRTLKTLSILFLFLFTVLFLSSCGEKIETKTIDGVEVVCYKIHTEKQNEYLLDSYDSISSYARGTNEESKPVSVKLSWSDDLNCSNYNIVISENSDYSNPFLSLNTEKKEEEVYNLKIKTIYYWRISSSDSQVSEYIEGKPFYIDETIIRNLNVEGVTNIRDVGGYKTIDGKTTRQGLVYRSSKFNNDESTELLITQKGIDTLINDLHIKTELDLRTVTNNENGGITDSPLGSKVEYISFPMESGGNIMLLNRKKLANLFAILGDESKYPLVFHCSIGTDRTGFVAFMMNCLLGVSEEDLYRDYLFSNFGEIGSPRTTNTLQKNYFDYLEPYEGTTLKEKLNTFLVKEGVNQDDIDSFIRLMKGE